MLFFSLCLTSIETLISNQQVHPDAKSLPPLELQLGNTLVQFSGNIFFFKEVCFHQQLLSLPAKYCFFCCSAYNYLIFLIFLRIFIFVNHCPRRSKIFKHMEICHNTFTRVKTRKKVQLNMNKRLNLKGSSTVTTKGK